MLIYDQVPLVAAFPLFVGESQEDFAVLAAVCGITLALPPVDQVIQIGIGGQDGTGLFVQALAKFPGKAAVFQVCEGRCSRFWSQS